MFAMRSSGSILYVASRKLAAVNHGFSSRLGGVSTGPYAGLNLGLHVGDDPAKVVDNRERWIKVFGSSIHEVVAGEQVHGTSVAVVGRKDWGKGSQDQDDALSGCDALISTEPGTALISFYADCVPVFLYDPVIQAVGIAHAGWKGTLAGIAAKAATAMHKAFGSELASLNAAIGPAIGPCCYEVSPELAAQFTAEFGPDVVSVNWMGRPQLDLWKANRFGLMRAGVKETNIETAQLCSACHPQLLYSYRHEKGPTGRMAAFIVVPGRE